MRRLTRLLALLMAICLLCGAFSGCGITGVSFGARLRSVGAGAFLSCARLTSAAFTGSLTPDYYGPEEKSPASRRAAR